MKVGKSSNRHKAWPAHQIRFDEDGQGYTHDRGITSELDGVRRRYIILSHPYLINSVFNTEEKLIFEISFFFRRNLFSGKRLNIFSPPTAEDGVDSVVGNSEF